MGYAIELVDPEEPRVALHVEVVGDADGESEFGLAEGWAGLTETGADLELVEARGSEGLLAAERVGNRWRVTHAPREPVALVFELGPTLHRADPSPPGYYLPILEPGLLHLIGAESLPFPTHLDGARPRPITLAWRGFREAGWRTLSSFGVEEECRVTRSLDSFLHALFLAGDLRLEARTVHGRAVWVSIHGAWRFAAEEFADLAVRIVALGRDFFADHEQPYYLVSLIGVGEASERNHSYGGTGLQDSFALFVSPGLTLEPMEGGAGIAWLLAHELFHEWNGQTIRLAQPEALGYWFTEGFTDFYARRLLHRAGMLEGEVYLDSWNRKLAALAANPERGASAQRVAEAFWTERSVSAVPYERGDLIALFVDHAIGLASGGKRSLDDLMRTLASRAREGAPPFTNEALIAAIGEFAGAETAEIVRAWAVEGREPELAADLLGPEVELVPVEHALFDTGFDHEATLRDGVVRGVRAGGCAEQAGLRDGMRFASWSVRFGQVEQPIEVGIREGGQVRKIAYLPRGASVSGWLVRPRAP